MPGEFGDEMASILCTLSSGCRGRFDPIPNMRDISSTKVATVYHPSPETPGILLMYVSFISE
jgi:hypothetical protein